MVIGGDEPNGGGGDYSGGGGSAETEKIIHQPKMLLDTRNLSGKTLEAGSEETLTAAFQNRSLSEEMYKDVYKRQPLSSEICCTSSGRYSSISGSSIFLRYFTDHTI